jgi:predicted MFS family arabinose efflux permease
VSTRSKAFRFVFVIGIVNLFADFTYEAARSINGQFLEHLGASATVVGFTAGFGELLGFGLRSITGFIADKTGKYWVTTITGYVINMVAVPLLALTNHWPVAAGLMIAERVGRAIRKPSTSAMLSHAGAELGHGWVFGLNDALDQLGAMLGPFVVALVLFLNGSFHTAYAVLTFSALCTIVVILIARHFFPRPQDLDAYHQLDTHGWTNSFWLYLLAACCLAAGFVDFALIAYHLQQQKVASESVIPVLYGIAMGIGALGAIALGKYFDRLGIRLVIPTFFISAFFVPLVFLGNEWTVLIGMILWGLNLSGQETILKALVAQTSPSSRKATAFGVFDTGYGIAWFAGSWFTGFLYGRSLHDVIIFSLAAQLLSLPIFAVAHRSGRNTSL